MNKKDAHDFLTNLMKNIKESDKKEVDSKPTLFFIQERKKITASDGCGDGVWYRYKDDSEVVCDSFEDLKTFLDDNPDYCVDDFYEVEYQEIWETKALAFLTRESAQNHIGCNYYNKARTYSRGIWRDPLMEGLFKALRVLYGETDGVEFYQEESLSAGRV